MGGRDEYILLPIPIYHSLQTEIAEKIKGWQHKEAEYLDFSLEDFVSNPVALARIKAKLTQTELAEKAGVSQAYISKLEASPQISAKILHKIMEAIDR